MKHKPFKSGKSPHVNREELDNFHRLLRVVESHSIGADNNVRRASRKIQRLLSDSPEVATFWRSLSPETCGSIELLVTLLDLNDAAAPRCPAESEAVSPIDSARLARLTEEARGLGAHQVNSLARWKLLEIELGRAISASEFSKMPSVPEAKK